MMFFVTVNYQTKQGRAGEWSGEIAATWDTVHEAGAAAARKARRYIGRITGSRAVPAQEQRI